MSGANTSSPFDGTAATNASGDITGYSTSNADDMLIAGYREGTYPSRAAGDFGSAAANLIASANYALTQNLPVTAIQSGITVTQTPDDGTQNGGIVDAIVASIGRITHIAHSNTVALKGGLLGYWTFDGATVHWGTGKVDDVSGQGNTGQMVGISTTTSVTPGVIGQALKFNGTNCYISEPASISGIESVAFWAKASTTLAVARGLVNLTGSSVYISTNSSKVLSATGFTSPTYYIDGVASSTPGLYDAKWHHVVVTGTAAITGSQVEIGRANSVYFGGTIDDVRMYNTVLTYQQIEQLYAMGKVNVAHSINSTPSATKVIELTATPGSLQSWTVPSDWNNSNNSIQTIGGGGSGDPGAQGDGGGGGGGAWNKQTNVTLSGTVDYEIGSGGASNSTTYGNLPGGGNNGGDTWFCNSTSGCTSITDSAVKVGSKGGIGGTGGAFTFGAGAGGGAGGVGSSGVGNSSNSGGRGGNFDGTVTRASTGGGGAGGPNGAGANGVDNPAQHGATNGGQGDSTSGGTGGAGSTSGNGGSGGAGTEYDATHGSGGGGGGSTINSGADTTGGTGGSYGAGGGGASTDNAGTANGGAGTQGIIVITYTPAVPVVNGLVGYWSMDGPYINWTAGTMGDASGQGNTGTLVGMSQANSPVPGKIGQALKFNGTNSYISESTSISGIKTVVFWAKASTTLAVAQGLINLTGSTVYISTNSSKVLSATGFTSPTYYIDGAASSTPGLYDAKWHHVVVTGTAAITGSQVEIGRANSVYFGGTIDDVRMYNTVLTYQQIQQLYAMGALSI